jgi:hypothetical protein
MTLRSPASVAVHDDGDVRRETIARNLTCEPLVRMTGRNGRQQLLKRHDTDPVIRGRPHH